MLLDARRDGLAALTIDLVRGLARFFLRHSRFAARRRLAARRPYHCARDIYMLLATLCVFVRRTGSGDACSRIGFTWEQWA